MALVFRYPRTSFDFDTFDPFYDRYYEPVVHLVSAPRPVSKVQTNEDANGWTVKVSLPGIRFQEHVKVLQGADYLRVVANNGTHKYSEKIVFPPGAVDLDHISAQFENQVLTVSIPKLEKKPEEREIQIMKTEAQQREEEEARKREEEARRKKEEAKKKQEEKKKKMELLQKKLSGPKVTCAETETHNTLNFEFAEGVGKDNINIEILGKVLTVTVNIQEEEFKYSYQKSVSLPDNVTADQVSATFEGNTLVVTYPKEEPKKSFKITIAESNSTPSSETQSKSDAPAPSLESSSSPESKEQAEPKKETVEITEGDN